MKLLGVEDVIALIKQVGLADFYTQLIATLETDFWNWSEFYKSPRHAMHFDKGVIELMPCANDHLYSFKYVNGHPENTQKSLPSVLAFGVLANTDTGLPLMISEMTLLTALRTAATSALGAKYMAREGSHTLGIIGTGSQAEFQVLAMQSVRPIKQVHYFDIDPDAMQKFAYNMVGRDLRLIPETSSEAVAAHCDILVTATAAKKKVVLFPADCIKPGTHIHAMGGDCPGKTELPDDLLHNATLVVEYLPQSLVEGEIQNADEVAVFGELWELVGGHKHARTKPEDITIFDSVGFALEDFSILKLVYELSENYGLGQEVPLIAMPEDPKNLFGLL